MPLPICFPLPDLAPSATAAASRVGSTVGRRVALAVALVALLASCDAGAGVGLGLINENGGVFVTDTLTLRTSTVLLDSIATQEAALLLAGTYLDPELGPVEARGFVEFAPGPGFQPDDAAVYDSLTLRLVLDYSYGVTDVLQTLQVHRVLDPIEPDDDDDVLYNSDAFAFDPVPLGSRSFVPDEIEDNERVVEIRLDDALGRSLFEAAQNDDEVLSDVDAFQAFLRGLAVVPESGSAVLGFEALAGDSSAIDLRLHYRDDADSGAEPQAYAFRPTARYFSQIGGERPAPLDQLTDTGQALPTSVTADVGYVAAGTGLAFRVDIPAAYRVFFEQDGVIFLNGATLTLYPVDDTFADETPLLGTLEVYVADEDNENLVPLLNADDALVSGRAQVDAEFGGARYEFDVTRFVQEEIDAGFDTERGLVVLPRAFSYVNSVTRTVLGGAGGEYRAVLRLVYTAV